MFPPGDEDHMRDKLGTLPFNVESSYPDQCSPLHVIQSSGETIFVPRWVSYFMDTNFCGFLNL